MATQRVFFEEQKGVTAWMDITDGIVTAVSDPNLAAHYIGFKVEGAVNERQNLQLVDSAGSRRVAVPSPIKQIKK